MTVLKKNDTNVFEKKEMKLSREKKNAISKVPDAIQSKIDKYISYTQEKEIVAELTEPRSTSVFYQKVVEILNKNGSAILSKKSES